MYLYIKFHQDLKCFDKVRILTWTSVLRMTSWPPYWQSYDFKFAMGGFTSETELMVKTPYFYDFWFWRRGHTNFRGKNKIAAITAILYLQSMWKYTHQDDYLRKLLSKLDQFEKEKKCNYDVMVAILDFFENGSNIIITQDIHFQNLYYYLSWCICSWGNVFKFICIPSHRSNV